MQQRKLGASGPMVSAIGLGAMSFGGIFGPTNEGESLACLDAMLETGITFIDTANIVSGKPRPFRACSSMA